MARRRRETDAEREREAAWAAITIWSGFHPPERRAHVQRQLLDAMEDEFARRGIPAPAWVEELRARVNEEPPAG